MPRRQGGGGVLLEGFRFRDYARNNVRYILMHRALILAPFSASALQRLRRRARVAHESWLDTRRLYAPDELAERIDRDGVSCLVVEPDFVFDEVFEQAPGLRFVGVCRGSVGSVDVDAATGYGVLVVNTPARNARAVAEHTLGLMLALARRIVEGHNYVAGGRWLDPTEPYTAMRGAELGGRAVGMVGLGAIGRELARVCAALGMEVTAYDPYAADPPAGVRMLGLGELMAGADFVCVHAPATPQTRGLLSAEMLAQMKPTAFLVSAADPSVVARDSLVDTLRARRIAGAAFDVFETHPVAPDNPLLSLDNVILSPHVGGATAETVERHSRMMADDLLRYWSGERPLNLVNPGAWETRERDG